MVKRGNKKEDFNSGDEEKIEIEKRMFMWVTVGCIMVVFFIAWIFNLKYQFRANSGTSGGNFDWSQAKVQLDQAMAQVKMGIAEIKQLQDSAKNASSSETELSQAQIDALKGKLINQASSTIATSTKK